MFWVLCDHETTVWRQTKSLPMSNVRQRMSRRSSCPCLAVGIQCLFFCCLISYLFRVPAVADEPILIAEILASPESYHLDLVTVQGTVRHVERLVPYHLPSGSTCYGAYTFTLRDETGSLAVSVLGFCGTPIFREPPVTDGDRIILRAQIHAPDQSGSPGKPVTPNLPATDPNTVRAVANAVTHLDQ